MLELIEVQIVDKFEVNECKLGVLASSSENRGSFRNFDRPTLINIAARFRPATAWCFMTRVCFTFLQKNSVKRHLHLIWV